MATETTAPNTFVEQYGALKPQLPGSGLDWLSGLREAGIERFRALGLPTPKVEEWKYTNLRPLERAALKPDAAPDARVSLDRAPTFLGEAAGHRLVFVNGRLSEPLSDTGSLPEGVTLAGLAATVESRPEVVQPHLGRTADGARQPLLALNTAFFADGAVLHVPAGTRVEAPIELVFVGTGEAEATPAFHPRLLIVLEDGARATVVEHHTGLGGGQYLANGATEVRVGNHAALRHYKLQDESDKAFHVSTLHGRLAEGAFYDGFGLTTGARLSRNELHIRLEGAHAEARLNGSYLMRGKQHVDNTTLVEHVAPDTTCREVYKGALEDKARAVFQGKLLVHREAQRTDGHQLSQALLLSDTAESDSKPELEIYADDVVCSHGATTGQIDEESLFYLRSRGLSERRARILMLQAFAQEVIDEIQLDSLKEHVAERVRTRFSSYFA